jgi:hypothetical protein
MGEWPSWKLTLSMLTEVMKILVLILYKIGFNMKLIMPQKMNDLQIPKHLKDRNEARFIQFKRKMKMKNLITSFRCLTMFYAIDNIPHNIPKYSHIERECGNTWEYSMKYYQSHRTLLCIWIILRMGTNLIILNWIFASNQNLMGIFWLNNLYSFGDTLPTPVGAGHWIRIRFKNML